MLLPISVTSALCGLEHKARYRHIFVCWFFAIKCHGRSNVPARFLYRALIKGSFSRPASTHTRRHCGPEYDVIFQAELIVSGAQFLLSLWLQSDFALLRDSAAAPREGSNEELWEAGCLLATKRERERETKGGNGEKEDGSEAEEGEEWSLGGRWGREEDGMQWGRMMDRRKKKEEAPWKLLQAKRVLLQDPALSIGGDVMSLDHRGENDDIIFLKPKLWHGHQGRWLVFCNQKITAAFAFLCNVWGLSLLAGITVVLSSGVLTWIILWLHKFGVYVVSSPRPVCIREPFLLSFRLLFLINIRMYSHYICKMFRPPSLRYISCLLLVVFFCARRASCFPHWPIVGFLKNICEI